MGFLIALPLSLLGGFLGSLAFPSLGWWFLLFPSLVFLLWSVRRASSRPQHPMWARFWISVLWGGGFFAFQLRWLIEPADSFVPWVALVILETCFIWIFAEIWGRGDALLRRHLRLGWLLRLGWAPVAWVAVEQLRSLVPFRGFPWAKLAFALVDSPLVKWAPWGGTVLVSGITVLLCVMVLEFFSRSTRWGRRPLSILLAFGIVIFPTLVSPSLPVVQVTLQVAAVQGNTPGTQPQTAFGSPGQVLTNHLSESLRLAAREKRVDLVLWPENAADIDPETSVLAAGSLNRVTRAFTAPLLTGTLQAAADGTLRNTILVWNQGKATDTYTKSHLVPFGEYLPFRELLDAVAPQVSSFVPRDMTPGDDTAQLQVPAGKTQLVIASPICYEIADDELVRRAASGAHFIYVPTSNSFFGSSDEAVQQLAIARFRAAEHGLDLVQVSTMDSTARVSATGQLQGPVIKNFTAGSFVTEVGLRQGTTPATLLGQRLQQAVFLLFALGTVIVLLRTVAERRNHAKR